MDSGVEIKGGKEFQAKIVKLAKLGLLKKGLEMASARILNHIKRHRFIRSPSTRPVPGRLTARSGSAGLMGSYHAKLEGTGKNMLSRIGSPDFRAKVHEFGKTILPKKPGGRLVFRVHDGTLVFAKKVVLPPRPVLGAAFEGEKTNINKDFNHAIYQGIRRLQLG